MANPLGLAIGLLITAGVLIYKNWSPIKAFFVSLWNSIKTTANNAMNSLKATIASFNPLALFSRAFGAVFGFFGGLPARFRQYGSSMIQGLIGGLTSRLSALYSTISNMASGITSRFKGLMQINSPSKLFMKFGRGIAEGTAIGITNRTPTAVKATDAMAKRLAQTQYSSKVLARQSVSGGVSNSAVHFSPTININGNANVAGQLQEGLQIGYQEFLRLMSRYEQDKHRRAFA